MSEEIDPKRLVRSTPTKEGKEAHRAEGCELVYLPAYSPDYNPIEEAFAKIENLLRNAAARTKEALVEAIGVALSAVSAQDAGGFFEHAGYRSSSSPTVKRAVKCFNRREPAVPRRRPVPAAARRAPSRA